MSQSRKQREQPVPTSKVASARATHERPVERSFRGEIFYYLIEYRKKIMSGALGPFTDPCAESYRGRCDSLVVLGADFDRQLARPPVRISGIYRPRLQKVLEYVNKGTRFTGKSQDLSELAASYLKETTGNVDEAGSYAGVVNRAFTEKLGYIMNGDIGYDERAIEETEALFRQLQRAYPKINEQLCTKSGLYKEVDERRKRMPPSSLFRPTAANQRALGAFKTALDLIRGKWDVEEAGKALLIAQNELMFYLGQLGEKGLEVVGEKDARPVLEAQHYDPLRQLETILNLLNSLIGDYKDLVLPFRDLLRQAGTVTGKYLKT